MADNRVDTDTTDRRYFTITPRLVTLLCNDVYELALWTVVKEVAGESGECYLSTPDLAALAMQSVGKASAARKSLIACGLLLGELRRDPGYPQPVWHLRIPDLWEDNIEMSMMYPKIADRVAFKVAQRELSCGEGSRELSPGERGLSPDEGGLSPGETKKNQEGNPERRSNNPPTAGLTVAEAIRRRQQRDAVQGKIARAQAKKDRASRDFESHEEFRDSLCSLAQFIELNSEGRKFGPGQTYDKLLAMAPAENPRYPSPQELFVTYPELFGEYVRAQIAWADRRTRKPDGSMTRRKPISSLVTAITNYARENTGWFAFLAERTGASEQYDAAGAGRTAETDGRTPKAREGSDYLRQLEQVGITRGG